LANRDPLATEEILELQVPLEKEALKVWLVLLERQVSLAH
jgi:hypothetical protein